MTAMGPQACAPELSLVAKVEQDVGVHRLGDDELRVLRQLERRIRTGNLDAVKIRSAQRLAALGLAHHGRNGWRPSLQGLAYLGQIGEAPEDEIAEPWRER